MRPGLEAEFAPGEAPSYKSAPAQHLTTERTSKRSRVGLANGVPPPIPRLPNAPGKASPLQGLDIIWFEKLIRAGRDPHAPVWVGGVGTPPLPLPLPLPFLLPATARGPDPGVILPDSDPVPGHRALELDDIGRSRSIPAANAAFTGSLPSASSSESLSLSILIFVQEVRSR